MPQFICLSSLYLASDYLAVYVSGAFLIRSAGSCAARYKRLLIHSALLLLTSSPN